MNIEYYKVKPHMSFKGLNENKEPIFSLKSAETEDNQNKIFGEQRFLLDPSIRLQAFREKMRENSRKQLSGQYKFEMWSTFTELFNVHNFSAYSRNKTYTLATSNGRAIGLMTNYNRVTHQQLLQTVFDAGLAAYTDGWFTDHQMSFRIRLNTTTQGFSYLKIVNGFTGQVSLNYLFGIQIGNGDKAYQFTEPLKFARKRHLSKVGELLSVIDSAVATVRDMKIMDSLTRMRYQTAFDAAYLNNKITKRQQVLIDAVKTKNSEIHFINAMEMIAFLGGYRIIRGYANSVDKLVEPIVQLALLE